MKVLRTVEMPKILGLEVLRERYPGYKIVGAGGWWYPVEQTQVIFRSFGFNDLVDQVAKHYKGNGITPPSNLRATMEDWWCSTNSGSECGDAPPIPSHDIRSLGARFLRTFKAYIENGGQPEPQEEVERRAAICAGCPMNVSDASWCQGCFLTSLVAKAASLATSWTSSRDSELKSCGVCGCRTALKIHIPKHVMVEKELADKWPDHCWMKS